MYEQDTSYEQLVHKVEAENAEKLNIANNLSKVFTGSKAFLCAVSVAILFTVFRGTTETAIRGHWEAHWNSTGLCINGTDYEW